MKRFTARQRFDVQQPGQEIEEKNTQEFEAKRSQDSAMEVDSVPPFGRQFKGGRLNFSDVWGFASDEEESNASVNRNLFDEGDDSDPADGVRRLSMSRSSSGDLSMKNESASDESDGSPRSAGSPSGMSDSSSAAMSVEFKEELDERDLLWLQEDDPISDGDNDAEAEKQAEAKRQAEQKMYREYYTVRSKLAKLASSLGGGKFTDQIRNEFSCDYLGQGEYHKVYEFSRGPDGLTYKSEDGSLQTVQKNNIVLKIDYIKRKESNQRHVLTKAEKKKLGQKYSGCDKVAYEQYGQLREAGILVSTVYNNPIRDGYWIVQKVNPICDLTIGQLNEKQFEEIWQIALTALQSKIQIDLKPDNLFISADQHIGLLDFREEIDGDDVECDIRKGLKKIIREDKSGRFKALLQSRFGQLQGIISENKNEAQTDTMQAELKVLNYVLNDFQPPVEADAKIEAEPEAEEKEMGKKPLTFQFLEAHFSSARLPERQALVSSDMPQAPASPCQSRRLPPPTPLRASAARQRRLPPPTPSRPPRAFLRLRTPKALPPQTPRKKRHRNN